MRAQGAERIRSNLACQWKNNCITFTFIILNLTSNQTLYFLEFNIFGRMKKLLSVLLVFAFLKTSAQSSFMDYQRNFPRVADALSRKADTLKKQFASAGLMWPAREIYIRSFKFDSQLEVWVRNNSDEAFKLFKTYPVCALAGTFGPKRFQGDYQVPE